MRKFLAITAASIAIFGSTGSTAERKPAALHRNIKFQGKTWAYRSHDRVTICKYGQKTALRVMGTQSNPYVFLPAVEFQDGTIEVDIAPNGRFTPGIGFRGLKNEKHVDKIMFSCWPPDGKNTGDVIEQALVTRRVGTVLLLNIRRGAPAVKRRSVEERDWIHVKVVVQGDRVKIFLNGSKKPDLEMAGMLEKDEKGTLGLCGGGFYFANFRYTLAEPTGSGNLRTVVPKRKTERRSGK